MEDRAVKGTQREVRVLGCAETPAENPARVAVHDDGEIAPGAPDFQIGDVADQTWSSPVAKRSSWRLGMLVQKP